MLAWLLPTSLKGLRGFIGFDGYYKKFIRNYGTISKPLTDILRKEWIQMDRRSKKGFRNIKRNHDQETSTETAWFLHAVHPRSRRLWGRDGHCPYARARFLFQGKELSWSELKQEKMKPETGNQDELMKLEMEPKAENKRRWRFISGELVTRGLIRSKWGACFDN